MKIAIIVMRKNKLFTFFILVICFLFGLCFRFCELKKRVMKLKMDIV